MARRLPPTRLRVPGGVGRRVHPEVSYGDESKVLGEACVDRRPETDSLRRRLVRLRIVGGQPHGSEDAGLFRQAGSGRQFAAAAI